LVPLAFALHLSQRSMGNAELASFLERDPLADWQQRKAAL
jgi:hypothetical protein